MTWWAYWSPATAFTCFPTVPVCLDCQTTKEKKKIRKQNTKQNMEWAKRSNERKCWLLNLSRLCHKFSYKTSWLNISNGPDIIVTAWVTLSIKPLKKKNVTSCSAAETFRDQGEVVKTSTAAVTQPHKYSIVALHNLDHTKHVCATPHTRNWDTDCWRSMANVLHSLVV